MKKEMMMLAVTGKPILHSKSPLLFNTDFQSKKIAAVYTRLAADTAAEAMASARKIGIRGLNITAPFKEEIIPCLDKLDKAALEINAVNTVVIDRKTGRSTGYNTDYLGVISSLAKQGIDPAGKKAVVLGAGGAGRAAVYGLLISGAEVCLINRTFARAKETAAKFCCRHAALENLKTEIDKADILISTVTTHKEIIPADFLKKRLIVFDANYKASPLSKAAQKVGCQTVITGVEWLLNQALPAYKLFTGQEADESLMRKTLLAPQSEAPSSDKIFLSGFMGSGKSSAGRELSTLLAIDFLDTDEEIEKETQQTIAEIFKINGEEYFRELETSMLRKTLAGKDRQKNRLVISSGGGIVQRKKNRELLKRDCLPVWLHVGAAEAVARLSKKGDHIRPLLDVDNPLQKAEKLLNERIPCYARAAALIVDTENKNINEVAGKIYDEICKTLTN